MQHNDHTMASNNGESSNASSPQTNSPSGVTHQNFENEMRIIVEDIDDHLPLNDESPTGTNFYSVRNATTAVEENILSMLRQPSIELERRGGPSRMWRLNLIDVLHRVRSSSYLNQNPTVQQTNDGRTEHSRLMTGGSHVHVHLENDVPSPPPNTTGRQDTSSQSRPPSDQPTTDHDPPRRFYNALADVPEEIRETFYTVVRHLPFALILIMRPIYDHFGTLFDMVSAYGLFAVGDALFMKQVARQTHYRKTVFFFNLLIITSCLVYWTDARSSYLNLLLVNTHIKDPISLGTLLYSTFLTDCLLKAISVLLKNLVAGLPGWMMDHRKRGRYYMLIEATFQLYRYLAPIQFWLLFHTGTGYHVLLQFFSVSFYLMSKFYFLYDHLIFFKKAVVMFPNRVQYGLIPSEEDLENNGGDCSICQDKFILPVMLNCSHVFCERCIKVWLRRKSTCPMCRASVGEIPWILGRTSQYIQLF